MSSSGSVKGRMLAGDTNPDITRGSEFDSFPYCLKRRDPLHYDYSH